MRAWRRSRRARPARSRTPELRVSGADASLAGGVLVDAHVEARLLGARVLKLDGVITVAPAVPTPFTAGLVRSATPGAGEQRPAGEQLRAARAALRRAEATPLE